MSSLYPEYRAAGRCGDCGADPVPGRAFCAAHAAARATRQRKWNPRRTVQRRAWARLGRCIDCGSIPVPGRSRCGYHLEQAADRMAALRNRQTRGAENAANPQENS